MKRLVSVGVTLHPMNRRPEPPPPWGIKRERDHLHRLEVAHLNPTFSVGAHWTSNAHSSARAQTTGIPVVGSLDHSAERVRERMHRTISWMSILVGTAVVSYAAEHFAGDRTRRGT